MANGFLVYKYENTCHLSYFWHGLYFDFDRSQWQNFSDVHMANNPILKWIFFLAISNFAIMEKMALRAQLRMHIAVWLTTY